MPCDVYIYNSSLAPLADPAILLYPASHPIGRNLARSLNNAQIFGSKKWGAHLPFALQQIVYTITAHHPNGTFSPVHVTNLYGAEAGVLEIVMFPKPLKGSQKGVPPKVFSNIAEYINSQSWNEHEKIGVRQLLQAVWAVHGTTDPTLGTFLRQWENWLDDLGIDPTLI